MLTQIGENMKKQLLLVSAILGLTTASFAAEREEVMGSNFRTYDSISVIGKALLESKPATTLPSDSKVFNAFAGTVGASTEQQKQALYGALVGESNIKAELSQEMAASFEAEKEIAQNALVKMFVDSMNERKVSAIKQLNVFVENYVGKDDIDPSIDLKNVEINDLVDAKIASVLESVTSNIDASIVNDFKAPIQNSLNAIKAELSAVKAFNTNSIRDIFASYDAASRDIVARDMAAKESEFESRVNFEVERRSNVGMNRSELRERETEDFGLEEKSTKFTSRKIEEPKIEEPIEEPIEKKPTQPAKKEEKKAYDLSKISEYNALDVMKPMPRANKLKADQALKTEYEAWVAANKPNA